MKQAIGIIGQGFVGGSLTTVLIERGIDVYAFDNAGKYVPESKGRPASITELVSLTETVAGFTGIYFVCVPTPMCEDGSADVSIVESVLTELAVIPGDRIAVIKSTVPPGSTEKWDLQFSTTGLRVIFNPEFLTEVNCLDDMRNQSRIILGGPPSAINTVEKLYQFAFPGIPVLKRHGELRNESNLRRANQQWCDSRLQPVG
jgi:UDPglucose 6-dehydrogenase